MFVIMVIKKEMSISHGGGRGRDRHRVCGSNVGRDSSKQARGNKIFMTTKFFLERRNTKFYFLTYD